MFFFAGPWNDHIAEARRPCHFHAQPRSSEVVVQPRLEVAKAAAKPRRMPAGLSTHWGEHDRV